MKFFDIKISRFGGRNLPKQSLSLSISEFNDFLSLLPTKKKLKKEKNKVRCQNI
jgi:hypothetical protein